MSGHYITLLVIFTGQELRILVSCHFVQLVFFTGQKVSSTCAPSLYRIISDFHRARVTNTSVRSFCPIINIFQRAKSYEH